MDTLRGAERQRRSHGLWLQLCSDSIEAKLRSKSSNASLQFALARTLDRGHHCAARERRGNARLAKRSLGWFVGYGEIGHAPCYGKRLS